MSTSNTVASPTARVIWVTGASSGLGRSLAVELAAKGYSVIASARNKDALLELEKLSPAITALPCDITDTSAMDAAQQTIEEKFSHLDQVILNAGTCEYLDFPAPDWSAIERVMDVNYFGAINCLRVALPLLRRSPEARPHIVAIASQVTNAPFPRAEAYGASKAALQYFLSSLRIDLARENIDISVINPGFVDTPLTRKNEFEMPFLMNVDDAARLIVSKIDARPRSFSFPMRLQMLLLVSKLMPRVWQKIVSKEGANASSAVQNNQDK